MIDCILIGVFAAGIVGTILFAALYIPRIRPVSKDDEQTPRR